MVCQKQSIDDANAEFAKDLRLLVRERLTDSDIDKQVLNYVVLRYGAFVLLRPRLSGRTALLWGAPIVLLLVGGASLVVLRGRRAGMAGGGELTADERARLEELIESSG